MMVILPDRFAQLTNREHDRRMNKCRAKQQQKQHVAYISGLLLSRLLKGERFVGQELFRVCLLLDLKMISGPAIIRLRKYIARGVFHI